MSDELAWLSAADLARQVRRRRISAVEVVEATIDRIETRNPSLNAFVFKGFDDARRAAAAADRAVKSGAELGPLHGVPSALKDLFDFKPGWPATFGGIRALKDLVLDIHCLFAERMEAAGAIFVGPPSPSRTGRARPPRQWPARPARARCSRSTAGDSR